MAPPHWERGRARQSLFNCPHKCEDFPVFPRGARNTWMQNALLAFPDLLFCPRLSTRTLSPPVHPLQLLMGL